MAAGCHPFLDLVEPEIAPFDPPIRKSYPRTKREVYRMTCCGDMTIRNSTYNEGCIWDPILREGEVVARRGITYRTISLWPFPVCCPFKSIMTIALSLTIGPQFGIEYLRRSNQHGGGSGSLGQNFRVFHWSTSLLVSEESEHPG